MQLELLYPCSSKRKKGDARLLPSFDVGQVDDRPSFLAKVEKSMEKRPLDAHVSKRRVRTGCITCR